MTAGGCNRHMSKDYPDEGLQLYAVAPRKVGRKRAAPRSKGRVQKRAKQHRVSLMLTTKLETQIGLVVTNTVQTSSPVVVVMVKIVMPY